MARPGAHFDDFQRIVGGTPIASCGVVRTPLLLPVLLFACSAEVVTSPDGPPPPVVTTANPPGPPVTPCSGQAGTFHDVPLESGGETRHYWLHVPASYACATPSALIVDFHGTGFGQESDLVEESWATPDLTSASDDLGFIVVRPRSRSAPGDGGNIYQWDINEGDVANNKAFASALVAELETRYNVQTSRVYATGFSNGPSMAAQFLGDEPSIMHGYGLVSGGLNAPLARSAKFPAAAPRVYSMTGFRDYMQVAKDSLDSFLAAHAYPAAARFNREADTGHEVYGWHFREAFAWMDRGELPPPRFPLIRFHGVLAPRSS